MAKTKFAPYPPGMKIDYSDIPRLKPGPQWKRGTGTVPPARNPQMVLQLAPDVTAWLQSLGKRARSRVNSILRAAMKAER